MSVMVSLRHGAASHDGLVRDHNEDSFHAGARLLAVADGVGGEAAGEVASGLTIEALEPLESDKSPGPDDLRNAVDSARRQIRNVAAGSPESEGMATTLTALLMWEDKLELAHVGDSRAYRLRDDELSQITRDDSYVQALLDRGSITAAEAAEHPYRSVVTRVLHAAPVEVHYETIEPVVGDRYLLCSDGLSDVVAEPEIAKTLAEVSDPQECADQLISMALAGGGPDNVTVIVADVADGKPDSKLGGLFKRGRSLFGG